MASTSWRSWVNWNQNIEKTLHDAQTREAGDASIDEAREAAGEDGSASVLDVYALEAKKTDGACWVLSPADLHQHFGSKTPHKKAIEDGIERFLKGIGRGGSVAVTSYLKGQASAVLFAGWSVD
jgi:hypothetical protein